jgi:FkbM family methyltransferase
MSETLVWNVIENLKPSGGTAFDIGANVGKYTAQLATRFGHVYAFEPHPNNQEKLTDWCLPHPNVSLIKGAISNRTGMGNLYTSRTNPGGHSISENVAKETTWGHDRNKYIEVKMFTIDDFVEMKNIDNLEFMKVDIEGAESFIFEGAQKTLKNTKLDIVLETHLTYEVVRLYDMFRNLGYHWYDEHEELTKDIRPNTHYHITNRE